MRSLDLKYPGLEQPFYFIFCAYFRHSTSLYCIPLVIHADLDLNQSVREEGAGQYLNLSTRSRCPLQMYLLRGNCENVVVIPCPQIFSKIQLVLFFVIWKKKTLCNNKNAFPSCLWGEIFTQVSLAVVINPGSPFLHGRSLIPTCWKQTGRRAGHRQPILFSSDMAKEKRCFYPPFILLTPWLPGEAAKWARKGRHQSLPSSVSVCFLPICFPVYFN